MQIPDLNAAILVADMYNDLEFWYSYYRLKEAGVGVTVVGEKAGALYAGKAGLPVHADVAAGQFGAADCDVLIIPGVLCPGYHAPPSEHGETGAGLRPGGQNRGSYLPRRLDTDGQPTLFT